MKKYILAVTVILSLAACTKEYVEPSSLHASNDGIEISKPKIYEGVWSLKYSNDTTVYSSIITK